MDYLFTSARLGFRNWTAADLPSYTRLCSDPEVMRHFPGTLNAAQSKESMLGFIAHFAAKGYSYYAVELLETGAWIGFIGLKYQEYTSPFTPAVDIGWRLLPEHWGQGYATEGARRCLIHAFDDLGLEEVIAVATHTNRASIAVMEKLGMKLAGSFQHEALVDHPQLQPCLAYRIQA